MAYEYDIFVSYGHADADTAACLASRLDDEGFRCFLAEKSIGPGELWEPRIRDALIGAERLLILITPNSKDSKWVNAEAGAAWALGKPLIPALMFVEATDLIELIRKHQGRPVHNVTEIDRFIADLRREVGSAALVSNRGATGHENFMEAKVWRDLLKIGEWRFLETQQQFSGKGPKTYLLSHESYRSAFKISTTLRFTEQHPISQRDNVNAGIVFAWQTETTNPRYYHIMFSGDELLLELVGGRGEAEYGDYRHLSDPLIFPINDATDYSIQVTLWDDELTVLVDGDEILKTNKLPISTEGRVGIRPWRSKIVCSDFRVQAL